ncbi:MAG: SGNH/GDSL hydrolase family protein [Firmicutes bacterium]|nr:SGNH/GDSL hydrolase family protein [Bacillota bacterium]
MSVYYDLGQVVGPAGPQGPSGSPLSAPTAAAMTDQTAAYLYTGSESGYQNGHVYAWNGTAFADFGPYSDVNDADIAALLYPAADASLWSAGTIRTANGTDVSVSAGNRLRTAYLPANIKAARPRSGWEIAVYVYDAEGVYQGVWNGHELAQAACFHSKKIRFSCCERDSRLRLVCRRTDDAALVPADGENIVFDWYADAGLSRSGTPAEAAAVGRALYRAKDRSANTAAAFTWWRVNEFFSAETPASPADMPVNSYTYALGSWLAGFNNQVFTLSGSAAYFVWCWSSLYNTSIREYLLLSTGRVYRGRTLDGGTTVNWANLTPKTVEAAPAENSANPVSAGGVYDALAAVREDIPPVDGDLLETGAAADAAAVGRALFRAKDRTLNYPAAFTWWEISAAFSSGAAPSDMPLNSYTEATGQHISGFTGIDVRPANTYLVWCWANLHNPSVRSYLVLGRAAGQIFFGRSTDRGENVTWSDWSRRAVDATPQEGSTNLVASGGVYAAIPAVDTGLSLSGGAAEAAAVGRGLFKSKDRTANSAAGFTWWRVNDFFSDAEPASPADMPINSYAYALGSTLAGFNNSVFTLRPGAAYFVWCWANLHNTDIRYYQIVYPGGTQQFVGRSLSAGAAVGWRDWSPPEKSGLSILYLGDSITRGATWETGSLALSPNRIPDMVGRLLGVNCQNFGIGSVGWLAGRSGNKTNAIGYLKRVGDPDYYDSSDAPGGYKFLGSGGWEDFNCIVLDLGTNDVSHPLGSIQDIDDSLTYEEVMALSPTTIVGAMYQCYRYIRNVSSTMRIILVDPLLKKGGSSGTAPWWGLDNVTNGGYTRRQLNQVYADFSDRYGLGHVATLDAPLDRVNLLNSLPDGVHPNIACYAVLGRYFAAKIGGLC